MRGLAGCCAGGPLARSTPLGMSEPRAVVLATVADIRPWLVLAGEVEPLFGPLVEDRRFRRALEVNLERG